MAEAIQPTDTSIPDYLHTLLEQIAEREGFTEHKFISEPGANFGDGFQGLMLGIVIAGHRNGNADDQLVLICKMLPLSDLRRLMSVHSFRKEIYAYDTLLPAIARFQREKGVVESDGFFAYPKCYGTYANEKTLQFALVLEDLRHSGYRMWDRYKPIDFQHVQLALAQLGRFHAVSFAVRLQNTAAFQQFSSSMNSSTYGTMTEFPLAKEFYKHAYDRAMTTLPPDDTEAVRKVKHLRNNFEEYLAAVVSSEAAEPYAVLCHGDFWNNNVMFQYGSVNPLTPQRAMLIDWQMGQYCSPATDLAYYIYSSTEQSVRTDHFDDFLHAYHDSLRDLLKKLGGDAAKQFSFGELRNQLNNFGLYGIIMAPILVQIATVQPDSLSDIEEFTPDNNGEKFELVAKANGAGYTRRMSDVIRDFVSRGFFREAI